ncbi:hypothetical protein [Clostridium sp. AF32-12BH]|uniref:hypothetical protein n=1 Tax=Clostridium sp. AF32-12BH TaxID=2292006 RepID=UPI000E468B0B|nr:hypothetical protein [Clostridium sp. AF32-12BH]RHP46975.1 hypothetical protein DWZ40_08705 [Clostridium sp. AF32-12BH]
MQINVDTRFNVGDEVWAIKMIPKYEVCDVCKGEKVLHFADYDWKCQKCGGSGKLHKNKQKECVCEKAKVTSITVTVTKEGMNTRYRVKLGQKHNSKYAENHLFHSEKIARVWCEVENKKLRGEEKNAD